MCMKISAENFRIPVAIPVNKNEDVYEDDGLYSEKIGFE